MPSKLGEFPTPTPRPLKAESKKLKAESQFSKIARTMPHN
jgi:hypothetical protein